MSLKRLGLSASYLLLAVKAQAAGGGLGAADNEPIRKLVGQVLLTPEYPSTPGAASVSIRGTQTHNYQPHASDHVRLILRGEDDVRRLALEKIAQRVDILQRNLGRRPFTGALKFLFGYRPQSVRLAVFRLWRCPRSPRT